MIDELKPYSEYKDSGLPWLGRVPGHWDVLPHRASFEEIKEREHPNEQMLSVTITRGIIKQRDLLTGSSKKDGSRQDKSAYKLVCPGDIAYNKMRAWQGAIGASDLRGIISPAYVVQRLRGAHNPRYFHHLFRTPGFAKEAESWSYGITSDMWSLRPEHFKAIYSTLPPIDEQATIVRFLDHATHRLDKAIRAKRKIIALLNEQKQAIIHHAVTRGLDPDVPLKDSGIPWLGQIPTHWELRRFKFLASINNGQVDPKKATFKNLPLIAPNHIKSGTGVLLFQQTADEQGADSGKFLVHPGQVIYSKIRPNLRKATIAPVECLCSADMYPITVKADLLSAEYLLVLLLSQPFTKFAVDCSMRVAMPKINREALANCLLWLPLLDEQSKILEFIRRESAPFESANLRLEREIELLREYRTRLIADVVTGKLDVREAAARLPEVECAPADETELAEVEESGEELAEDNA